MLSLMQFDNVGKKVNAILGMKKFEKLNKCAKKKPIYNKLNFWKKFMTIIILSSMGTSKND